MLSPRKLSNYLETPQNIPEAFNILTNFNSVKNVGASVSLSRKISGKSRHEQRKEYLSLNQSCLFQYELPKFIEGKLDT